RRAGENGALAVSRAVPVLRRRPPVVVPALSAQRRRVPRRAVQYRVVLSADAHDRAADRSRARRVRLDRRRLPPLSEPRRAGGSAAHARAAAVAAPRDQAPSAVDLRVPVRGLRDRRLRRAPVDQGADRGLTGFSTLTPSSP